MTMIIFVVVMVIICGFQLVQDLYWLGKGGVKRTYSQKDCLFSALIFALLTVWGIYEMLRGAIS